MKKSSFIYLAICALLAVLTFNPFGALLGTLSYKSVPAEQSFPEKTVDIRLRTSVAFTGMEGEGAGRKIKAGTPLKVLGTCHDIADPWSPRACYDGREYLVELPDGTRGRMQLPQMENDSTFLKMDQSLVYLVPGEKSAAAAIAANEAWIEAHKEGKFFTRVHGFLKKMDRGRLRLLKALSPKVSEGGAYFLFPRFSAWSVYRLPGFFRSSLFRRIWDFLCSVIFLLAAHAVARKLAMLPYYNRRLAADGSTSWATLIYMVLALGITYLAGITHPLSWIFLMGGFSFMQLKTDSAETGRCPHCRQMTMRTYRQETVQHNSHLVRSTASWKEGMYEHASSGYSYHVHKDIYRFDRCTNCGYERPKYKSSEEDFTEYPVGVTTDAAARDEFNKTNGKVTVLNFDIDG